MQESAASVPAARIEHWLDRLQAHLPTAREWLLSAKTFAAAMLAFYLALAAGLPRPYWALATVYVVSNPLTGATRSKGVYRVLGTLIGASAAVLVLPLLVDTPVLLSLFLSVWTGTLLYLSFLDRQPSSYVYLLAAYSLPMIALPMVQSPDGVFNFAVARSEEILLGIVCAALVSSLVLPGRAAPVLEARFHAWLNDAALWATGLLRSESAGRPRDAASLVSSHRLAADVLALDQFISHLRYDADSQDLVRISRELRMRLGLLLPTLSSLSSAVQALRGSAGGMSAALSERMDEIADWVAAPPSSEVDARGLHLQQRLRALAETCRDEPGRTDWDDLLRRHVLKRLEGLVQLWRDGRALQLMMAQGRLTPGWTPAYERWTFSPAERHHDHGMQLFSAASACTVTFLACLIWIFSGWSDGVGAVIMCAVTSCFFAAQDEPARAQLSFFYANALCLLIGLLLLFLILPAAREFQTLVLGLAPFFLVLGTLMTRPNFAVMALGLTVSLASSLGLSEAYSADFGVFVNSTLASVAGSLLALLWTLLTRPFGASLSLHRLLRSTWTDLAHTAAGRHRGDLGRLRARMIDRLAQLMPRLAAATGRQGTDGLSELRVGLSAALLQREQLQLPAQAAREVQAVLDALELHYRRRQRLPMAQELQPSRQLHRRLDHAVATIGPLAIAAVAEGDEAAFARRVDAHEVLHALAELRLSLGSTRAEALQPDQGALA
ncbi:MAG: FUSC family protein [Paucibacter sp.]|nr:FUSC family protein [Roseateles sp.]